MRSTLALQSPPLSGTASVAADKARPATQQLEFQWPAATGSGVTHNIVNDQ
jgi:hypothetical protein